MLPTILLLLVYPIYMQSIGASCVKKEVYWRDYTYGDIPCDAYQGAPGKYIGQFNYKSSDLVATIFAESGIAVASYDGKIQAEKDVRILCASDHSRIYWEQVDVSKGRDEQLQYAIKGGFQDALHYPLFIGSVFHEGEWRIGKVLLGYDARAYTALWVWGNDGKHVSFQQFFILKYNGTAACGNHCHGDNV